MTVALMLGRSREVPPCDPLNDDDAGSMLLLYDRSFGEGSLYISMRILGGLSSRVSSFACIDGRHVLLDLLGTFCIFREEM